MYVEVKEAWGEEEYYFKVTLQGEFIGWVNSIRVILYVSMKEGKNWGGLGCGGVRILAQCEEKMIH